MRKDDDSVRFSLKEAKLWIPQSITSPWRRRALIALRVAFETVPLAVLIYMLIRC